MSETLSDAAVQRVALRVAPKDHESLTGYLCRVARENVIFNPWQFVKGIAAWPPDDLTTPDRARLAVELGCAPETLEALFQRSHGEVFGPRIRSWKRRRVAPASLRLSVHHRSHWQVLPLGFCPESWGALIDQCPECGAGLNWRTNAIERCQRCRLDLRWVDTPLAPEEDRQELGLVTRLLTDGVANPRDAWWAEILTASELFDLIVATGRLIEPDEGKSPASKSRQLIAGLRTVVGAPGTIEALAKLDKNEREHPFFRGMRSLSNNRQGPLKEAMQLLVRSQSTELGLRRLQQARITQGLMTATDVADALQIERSQLRRLLDGGVLGERSGRGSERVYDWFSHHDLERLRTGVQSRVSAWTWGRRMGLTDVDIRQLLAERLIEVCGDDLLCATFEGMQLDARRTGELERSLRLRCEESLVTEVWVPVREAFQGLGGGYKPWAMLLQCAMRGELLHGLGRPLSGGFKIGGLSVHPADAAWIQGRIEDEAGFPTFDVERFGAYRTNRLAWGEVETLLNCNPADVARLLELGDIRRPDDREEKAFDARSVEMFARGHVSSLEMAALTGLTARTVIVRLGKSGWPRTELGFWSREALPEMLANLLMRTC